MSRVWWRGQVKGVLRRVSSTGVVSERVFRRGCGGGSVVDGRSGGAVADQMWP